MVRINRQNNVHKEIGGAEWLMKVSYVKSVFFRFTVIFFSLQCVRKEDKTIECYCATGMLLALWDSTCAVCLLRQQAVLRRCLILVIELIFLLMCFSEK